MEKSLLFLLENPWVIAVVLIWTLPWKGAALWKAARRGQFVWFVMMLVLNTFALLEISYLFFHRKRKISQTLTNAAFADSQPASIERERRNVSRII